MLSWLRFFLNTNTLFSLLNIFIDPFFKFCWIAWGNAYVSVYFFNFILFTDLSSGFLLDVGARASVTFFKKKFVILFKVKKKTVKRRWARFGLSFAVGNISKIAFAIRLRLHKKRETHPVIIRPGLWFSSFCFREIPRDFQNLINFSCRSFKSRKSKGYQGGFLAICNFVFSSSISNLVLLIFFPSTGNRKDTNMFNVSAKL